MGNAENKWGIVPLYRQSWSKEPMRVLWFAILYGLKGSIQLNEFPSSVAFIATLTRAKIASPIAAVSIPDDRQVCHWTILGNRRGIGHLIRFNNYGDCRTCQQPHAGAVQSRLHGSQACGPRTLAKSTQTGDYDTKP